MRSFDDVVFFGRAVCVLRSVINMRPWAHQFSTLYAGKTSGMVNHYWIFTGEGEDGEGSPIREWGNVPVPDSSPSPRGCRFCQHRLNMLEERTHVYYIQLLACVQYLKLKA
jgi:hypothetical protein